jgi:hypothetical protein
MITMKTMESMHNYNMITTISKCNASLTITSNKRKWLISISKSFPNAPISSEIGDFSLEYQRDHGGVEQEKIGGWQHGIQAWRTRKRRRDTSAQLSVDVGGINFSADGVEFFEEAA